MLTALPGFLPNDLYFAVDNIEYMVLGEVAYNAPFDCSAGRLDMVNVTVEL
jgi:hypothetical protein